jgi:hypothetical protein
MLLAIDFGISNTDIIVNDGKEYKFFSQPDKVKRLMSDS